MVEWVGWGFLWNWQRMETTDNDGYLPSVICECVLCGERDPIDPQVLVFWTFLPLCDRSRWVRTQVRI